MQHRLQQQRKRKLSLLRPLESCRLMKRIKVEDGCVQVQEQWSCFFPVPVQLEAELGPFWVTAGSIQQQQQHTGQEPEKECLSLGSWGPAGVSISLHRSSAGMCGVSDDDETQDTASSGSEGDMLPPSPHYHHQQQQHNHQRGGRQPRMAAAGDEDSITSCQQPPGGANGVFSFGNRPYVTPDLSLLCRAGAA